ncbi:MAG: hypothetical protein J2P57_01370 [Acidimicrobiaceae bacterium]|nr:hypothetical protein [Acidimicrobiaceae bacterium]
MTASQTSAPSTVPTMQVPFLEPASATLMRQAPLWEGYDDPSVVAEWVALTALPFPEAWDADEDAAKDAGDNGTRSLVGRGLVTWHTARRCDPTVRRVSPVEQ